MADTVEFRRAIPAGMRIAPWLAPDGWPLRSFDWPTVAGTERGSILFLGGRGDFIEKYLETLHHLHDRGWNLAGFDWRGQGGSGRLLPDRTIGHAIDFAPMVQDLDAFLAEWRASTPGPHVAIGHSMGGHLLVRLLAERDAGLDAAILSTPMLGLATAPIPRWLAPILVNSALFLGLSERPAWGTGDRPDLFDARRRLNLTHCAERYEDEQWWRRTAPENVVSAPTWGWLRAALRSIALLAEPGMLEGVRIPILLLGAPRDRLVSAAAITAAAQRLPDVELHMYPEAAHELLRESDPIRLAVYAAIDSFLDRRTAR